MSLTTLVPSLCNVQRWEVISNHLGVQSGNIYPKFLSKMSRQRLCNVHGAHETTSPSPATHYGYELSYVPIFTETFLIPIVSFFELDKHHAAYFRVSRKQRESRFRIPLTMYLHVSYPLESSVNQM